MRRLQSLNLADNDLSGEIPPALGGLPDLRLIHLAGNKFSGCVPQGFAREGVSALNPIGLPFCGSSGGTADMSASAPQSATPAPAFYAALALAGAVFAIGSLAMFAPRR